MVQEIQEHFVPILVGIWMLTNSCIFATSIGINDFGNLSSV